VGRDNPDLYRQVKYAAVVHTNIHVRFRRYTQRLRRSLSKTFALSSSPLEPQALISLIEVLPVVGYAR
jgi:hypothetical protein